MSYQAGDTYPATITVRDEDSELTDPTTLTLKVRTPAGVVTPYLYPAAPTVRDSVGVYHADVELTTPGMWVIQWATTQPAQVEGVQVYAAAAPTAAVTFATLDELALRLGKTGSGDLTAAQSAQGAMLLELVTGLIVDAVDRDDTWAATYSPVRRELRAVTLEAVARVMQNPSGARSESETLGQYQHSASYTDHAHGLELTEAEARMCRRAVIGQTSGSACLQSTLNTGYVPPDPDVDIYDWLDPVYPPPTDL